jgi:hypothetical protein
MKLLSYNAFTLKVIAVVAMILNHAAIGLQPLLPFGLYLLFYAVGGATYVIMAYFVVEGYRHTSNLKKYIGRLLIFGVIAQAFHPMVLASTAMMEGLIFVNIMFTISLSLLVLLANDRIKNRFLFWVLFVVACIISIFMDLGFIAVTATLLYHKISKSEELRRTLPGVISGIYYFAVGILALLGVFSIHLLYNMGMYADIEVMLEQLGGYDLATLTAQAWAVPTFALGAFLGAILIRNFNGERGRRAKWLFYVAYPAHLAVIALIMVLAGIVSFNLFGFMLQA